MTKRFFVVLSLLLVATLFVQGFGIKKDRNYYDDLAFKKSGLWTTQQNYTVDSLGAAVNPAITGDFFRLQADNGVQLQMYIDRVTGLPNHIEGEGIPFIPGTANNLNSSAFGLPENIEGQYIPLEIAASRALEFVKEYPELFGVTPDQLSLNRVASGPMLDYLYFVEFDCVHGGIPVEKAGISFRVNHGNIIQIGQTNISRSLLKLDVNPSITIDSAWDILWGYLGEKTGNEEKIERGRLVILPVTSEEVLSGAASAVGEGLSYRLAYAMAFRVPEVAGTWEAKIDAHTGEILSFLDYNKYGHIQGGVHLTDGYPADTVMPFPYANYSGTTNFADAAGNYTGTTGTSTMVGDLVRITDSCGTISKASDGTGLINFGTNTGTNCTTPGTGGAGNTRAARTQYWHVTSIKIKALTYMPSNSWLNGQLLDRTNLTTSGYCPGNAWWDGTALNFCVGNSTYGNTGELPGVSLHEWGHGMDEADGKQPADEGTGETYGDFSGTLQTHDSCVGDGFTGTNCSGYGDACKSCKGIRDMDYAAHQSGTPHTPLDLDDSTGYRCIQYGWPYTGYEGPCRFEGHCESYISSEACWDLAARDLPAMGIDTTTAWQIMDRLWYASRGSALSAYVCTASSPGVVTASSGNTTGSLYNIFRAVDDCDGNLTNGTPHANAIFDAMARHNIAIGADGDATNQNQTNCCPSLATPSLSGSAASCQNNLSWGDITNATRYKVYRNETGCTAGFTLVATVNDPTLTYADTNVSAGTAYYYRVQAFNSSDACGSAMSNCVTVTAAACGGCTAPSAPTGVSVSSPCSPLGLSWNAVSGASGYNVYRYTGTCTGATWSQIGTTTSTSYSDSAVSTGTTYAYMVRAYAGETTCESSNSTCVSATVLSTPAAPSAPTTVDGCTGLTVNWTAVSGATSYTVQRGTKSNCSGLSTIGTSAVNSYLDETAAVGTTYYYSIIATNSCGSSANSACGSGTHNTASTPGAPSITSITDESLCAQSGIRVNFTGGTNATSHNLVRNGTVVVTGYTSGSLYNPGATTSYTYIVRAVNSCGSADSTSQAFSDSNNTPGAPTITGITDNDSCVQDGIRITYTAGSGALRHDLYRDGALVVTGYVSNAVYNPGDTAGHTYIVRAINGTCFTNSGSQVYADGNSVPGAPSITSITDNSACAQDGIRVNYTAGSGATSHNLLRNGSVVVTGYTSGAIFNPGATTSYSYVVRSINTCGSADSASQSFSDANGAPGAPSITGITDESVCLQSGIRVTYTAGSGATSHNLVRDGSVVVTGYASNALYNPGDSASHSYMVRAVSGSCSTDSTSSGFTDAANVTIPTITGASSNTCPATTVVLTTESGMSSYQWYTGGSPISGANSNTYVVTATGNYTVSYTNGAGCNGTSTAKAVTISVCAPNIVYQSASNWTQVTGDGDANYEKGEKWSVQVTLANNGTADATNVFADLQGNGITVCNNPGIFNNIAQGGTSSYTYQFVISPSFTPCGGTIGFDVANKACAELTPAGADQLDVFSVNVGQATGGTTTLFGPDSFADLNNWTASGYTVQTGATCHDTNYARSNGNGTFYLTLASPVSTVGLTGITVNMDWGVTSPAGTTHYLDWSIDGTSWNEGVASTSNNGMLCNQSQVLPAGAEGQATLYIRFRTITGNSTRYCTVDYVSITGSGAASWDCSYVGSGTCEVCVTPGTPVIDSVTDVSACAQSGVQVNYTANAPYTTHDLYVDGSIAVSDYASGATYNPGNTSSHNYVVRAINGLDTCYADSSLTAGTDANNTPGAPTVTAVNDVSACAQSGVQVVYTAGSGATSHNLYDNGSLAVTGYASGATYNPGNTASHNYTVYAVSGTCTSSVSNSMAGTDASNTPVPTISGASSNTCPATTVALTTENGMSSYQWYVGGSPIGGANAYQYTVTASGTYTVSYTNGSGCSGTSAGHAVTISSCAVVPGEVAVGSDFTWTGQTIGWTANADATGYRVYRGLLSNLSALCDGTNDFCTRNDAASTSLDVTGDDPSGQAGRCFYYLITGYSGAGEGPAGTATCGTRQVNQTGGCS